MTKVFVKAIINTLVGIFAVAVVAWAVITLAFPSALVNVTSSMGWTRVSAWYAASSYVRTRDLNDLAQAVDMSISSADYHQVVKYGGMLLRQDGFEEFCTERDSAPLTDDNGNPLYNDDGTPKTSEPGTYKKHYYNAMVEARYNTGYKTDALELAVTALNEGITDSSGEVTYSGEVIYYLAYIVIDASDADWCARIKTELEKSSVEHDEKYETIISALAAMSGESAAEGDASTSTGGGTETGE